jgi:hypothetical protein
MKAIKKIIILFLPLLVIFKASASSELEKITLDFSKLSKSQKNEVLNTLEDFERDFAEDWAGNSSLEEDDYTFIDIDQAERDFQSASATMTSRAE